MTFRRISKFFLAAVFPSIFLAFLSVPFVSAAEEGGEVLQSPKIYLNRHPANVTVQDLSGLGTRPLRLLMARNNRNRGEHFMTVYALGVQEGDELTAEITVPAAGVRATVYKLFRGEDGPRYLTMPASFYFNEVKAETFQDRVESFEEEFLIFVFEKTQSPDEKNIQIRYFEERVRKLVVAAYRTNLLFSSLKFKLKDFAGGNAEKFFERDAQLLVDRLIEPQRIVMLRLWRIKP